MAGGAMMDFGQGFIDRFGKNYKPSRFIIEAIGGQNG